MILKNTCFRTISVIKAYMHDTTAPKENSSKLVKQKDISCKQNKRYKWGRSPNTLDRHRLYKAQPFTLKNTNQNTNK